ncbi:hypothetical protein [Krasilnikovia sp. MM14-A1259]|uniref:hypothetical protein n=1 Tax=Krasilnikovia sp. MM14-A1259 TaxID=3373539 RepID=UPI00399CBF6B
MPQQRFAEELRQLRVDAGRPSYRQMARRAARAGNPYSATALWTATKGAALPTLELTLAYVQACGADPGPWRERHAAVRTAMQSPTPTAAAPATTRIPVPADPGRALSADPAGPPEPGAAEPGAAGPGAAEPGASGHGAAEPGAAAPAAPSQARRRLGVLAGAAVLVGLTVTVTTTVINIWGGGAGFTAAPVVQPFAGGPIGPSGPAAGADPSTPPSVGATTLVRPDLHQLAPTGTTPAGISTGGTDTGGTASGGTSTDGTRTDGTTTPTSRPTSQRPAPTGTGTGQPGTVAGPPATTARGNGEPGVHEQRIVTLSTQPGQESVTIDDWRQMHDNSGDLHLDAGSLNTTSGAAIAVVPTADWATCTAVRSWQTRIAYSSLSVATQLCGYSTEGRYARLQVRSAPTSGDQRLVFYGYVWELTG